MASTQVEHTSEHNDSKSFKVVYKKAFQMTMVFTNLISLILGIVYSISPSINTFWNVYGVFLILTLLGNIALTLVGGEHKKLDYLYLTLSSLGMFVVMVINTLVSLDVTNISSRSIVSIMLLNIMFIVGGAIAGSRSFHGVKADEDVIKESNKNKKVVKKALIVFLSIILLVGIYVCYALVIRERGSLYEMLLPEYSFFYGIIFLSVSALILKLSNSKMKSAFNMTVLTSGIIIFVVCALPLLSVPSLINHAEKSYSNAFGVEQANISDKDKKFFRNMPFSIPEYFFGTPSGDYIVKEDIVYYEGTEGIDKGVKLRFDAYMPPKGKTNLPGQNSVLIRIHGGAWNIGDKGFQNYAQVNKYFATQGYVVFDIQYGLNDEDKFIEFAPIDEDVMGGFSIDDMIRHIGVFTSYLADNKDEYGANIDSVFISGGSAGGQLTNAVALGIHSGEYTDILDSRLNIKGAIPFYPANGLANIGGDEKLVDPDLLVKSDSPPCLIYQGDMDGIVNSNISKDFRDVYLEKGNDQCALILMPYARHASDLYFSGYYNQVFIYHMERFMYQFK